MSIKSEYLIDKIFDKLKKFKTKKIYIKKDEFKKFIYNLMNNKL